MMMTRSQAPSIWGTKGIRSRSKKSEVEKEVPEAKAPENAETPAATFALDGTDKKAAKTLKPDDVDFDGIRERRISTHRQDRGAGGFKGSDSAGPLRVIPLYAQLSAAQQMRAFADPVPGERVV